MNHLLRLSFLALPLWAAGCSAADLDISPAAQSHPLALDFGAGSVVLSASLGDQLRWLGFESGVSYWQPSALDIEQLEKGLKRGLGEGAEHPQTLSDYAIERPDYQNWVRDRVHEVLARLPEYRRQYVGFVTEAGERRILLRGFPGPSFEDVFEFPRWQEEIVVVSDGGSRYWSVVYDVASGTLREFACNGEA